MMRGRPAGIVLGLVVAACVSAGEDLIKEIRQNPANYYVNVHNADFPDGAIRGQLSK